MRLLEIIKIKLIKIDGLSETKSFYESLTEDYIRKYDKYLDWSNISQYRILSESFIREFEDEVHWNRIGEYQKLSEDFIREFKDKLSYYNILIYQELTNEFRLEIENLFIIGIEKLNNGFGLEMSPFQVRKFMEKQVLKNKRI